MRENLPRAWGGRWCPGAPMLLAVLWLPVAPAVLRAQAAAVRVAAGDTAARTLDPGEVASVAFLLVNTERRPAEVDLRLELPATWRGITGAGAVRLPPEGRDLRIASFSVPPAARAGTYQVALSVAPARTDEAAGIETRRRGLVGRHASVTIHVRERWRLAVHAERVPAHMASGARVEAVFVASNLGNAPAVVRARPSGGSGLEVHADTQPFALAPGEVRTVTVAVHARATELREGGGRHVQLRIEAATGAAADATAWASASRTITVLPALADDGDMLHRLPTSLTLRSVGRGGDLAAHGVTWSGAGPVGDGGATRADFLVRWSRTGVGPLGERDVYRLTFRGPGYELRFGDQSYALSPLTGAGRVASGVGARVSRGALTAGGHAARDRWSVIPRREHAAFVQLGHRRLGETAVHLLDRDGPDGGRLWSARARLAATPLARAELEYGRGLGALAGERAWRASLAGAGRRFGYQLHALHADSAYPGASAGRDERTAAVSFRPWERLQLGGRMEASEAIGNARWASGGAMRQTTAVLAMEVARLLRLEYRAGQRTGAIFGGTFDARERAGQLWLGGGSGPLQLSGVLDGGTITDRRSAERSPFGRAAVEARLQLGGRTHLGGQVEHRVGRTLYSPLDRRSTVASLSGAFEPHDGTRLGLSVVGTDHGLFRAGRLEIRAEQALAAGHSLSARLLLGTHALAGGERSLLRLEYALPLGAPLGYRRDVGRFAARVVDAERGRGLPGLVVRVGALTLVTDGDGWAGPVAVPAGGHVLALERTGDLLGRVAMEEVPPVIAIEGGRTSTIVVPLARGARLVGSVRRWARVGPRTAGEDMRPQVDSAGVERLVVLLTRRGGTSETLRRATDRDGRVVFDDLPPGRWTIRVEGDLPPDHQLVQATAEVALGPGGRDSVAFRVLPRRRQVQIVAQGEVRAASITPIGAADTPDHGGGRRHRVTPTQRTLADVARDVYGDSELWPQLWLANRAVVADPSKLRPGTILAIPPRAPLSGAARGGRHP